MYHASSALLSPTLCPDDILLRYRLVSTASTLLISTSCSKQEHDVQRKGADSINALTVLFSGLFHSGQCEKDKNEDDRTFLSDVERSY